MANEHSIRIGADVKTFKRDVIALAKELDRHLGSKKKIEIFDKGTREFIAKGAKYALGEMRKEVERLEKANKSITQELKKQKTSEEELRKKQLEVLKNKREILKLEKDMNALTKSRNELLRNQSALSKFGGGFAGAIPGLGKLMGLGGVGLAGLAGSLAGAGAVGLAGLGISEGFQGYRQFSAGTGQRVSLMGRGFTAGEASGMAPGAAGLGMTPEQLRAAQMQAVDIFGKGGASQEAILKTQRAARGMGVGIEQLLGAGGGLVSQIGKEQGMQTFAQLIAITQATELEGRIGPFLETAAKMLTQINEDGMGLDNQTLAMLSAMSATGKVTVERVATTMQGIDARMRGATGETAAFFMSALTGGGIGGGTLGGAQIAMQQGLFGGNLGKAADRGFLTKQDVSGFKGMNFGSFAERAGAITGQFEQITGGMETGGQALVARQLLGIDNAVQALEAMRMLKRAATATPEQQKDIQEKLEELVATAEEKTAKSLAKIEESSAGALQIAQANLEQQRELLGEELAPLGIMTNKFLASIDSNISSLLRFFGASSAQEREKEEALKGQLGKENFIGMSKGKKGEVLLAMKEEAAMLKENIEENKQAQKRRGMPLANDPLTYSTAIMEKQLDALNRSVSILEQLMRKTDAANQNTGLQGK
jgi:hypothetical protein